MERCILGLDPVRCEPGKVHGVCWTERSIGQTSVLEMGRTERKPISDGGDAHKKFSVFVAVNEKGQAGEALRVNHKLWAALSMTRL